MLIEHTLAISLEISAPHAEQAKLKEKDKNGKRVILRKQEVAFKTR